MRVLLVNPSQVDLVQRRGRIYARRWTPLDLATTAAWLEQDGVSADILDANAEQIPPAEVARRAVDFDKVFPHFDQPRSMAVSAPRHRSFPRCGRGAAPSCG